MQTVENIKQYLNIANYELEKKKERLRYLSGIEHSQMNIAEMEKVLFDMQDIKVEINLLNWILSDKP